MTMDLYHERRQLTRKLVEHGEDINKLDSYGRSPLMHSIEKETLDVVESLLNSGADVNARDKGQTTALMIASERRRTVIVEKLIRHGANINVQDLWGRTAVMIACDVRAVEVIVLLCKHGAKIDLIDQKGDTAMTKVWLLEKAVKALLQAGAHADAVRRFGKKTLFMVACLHRNKSIMELLLKYDVDVNAQDNKGTTPLMMACKNDFPEIATLLLQQGADVNVQSKNGTTAAILASKKLSKECLEILLAAGANLDLIDHKGCTIFSYLLRRFYGKEILTLLFENCILLANGTLKDVHFNAKNYFWYSQNAKIVIDVGAFDWGWVRYNYRYGFTKEALAISSLAMSAGFCPGKIIYCPLTPLSPLLLSLWFKDTVSIKAFLKHRYFFPEDYRRLINDSDLKKTIGNPPQLCEIINKPLSLLTWSFLTVSKTISLAGHPVSRCQRVDALSIPHKLKEMLKFRS